MPRPLEQAVVAITGASSGIGRASALVRSLDVSDEEAVEAFARAVEERFGRIDVWLNNAGVIAYGEFLEIPSEVFRQVIETNLMGQVHGARAALRRFRAQGSGVLINLSSVWGRVSSPQVSPYIASKYAIRAFSEALRGELAGERDVHVVSVVPEATDTPIFDHGANYSGRRIRPVPPVLSPEEVAEGIEACAESPLRELSYGRAGRALEIFYAFAPPLYRRIAHPAFVGGTMAPQRAAPASGNVLAGSEPHVIEGDWSTRRRPTLRRAFLAAFTATALGLIGARSS